MGNGEWEIENGKLKKSKNRKKYEIVTLYKSMKISKRDIMFLKRK